MSGIFINDTNINFWIIFPYEEIIEKIKKLWYSFNDLEKLKKDINNLINSFIKDKWLEKQNNHYKIGKKSNYLDWFRTPKDKELKEIEKLTEKFYTNSNEILEKDEIIISKIISKINELEEKTKNKINNYCDKKNINIKVKEFFNDLIDLFFEILKLILNNIIIKTNNTTMAKKEETKEISLNDLYEKMWEVKWKFTTLFWAIWIISWIFIWVLSTAFWILYNSIDRVETSLKTEINKVDSKIEKVESNLKTEINKVETNLSTKIDKVEANLKTEITTTKEELNAKIDKLDTKLDKIIEKLDK